MPDPDTSCAHELVETVPLVMAVIRAEMRAHRQPANLSVPQFRTLVFLSRHPGAALIAVADHIGLTAPSMSRQAEDLVRRGLVERRAAKVDRRQVELSLTARGKHALQATRLRTQARLGERMAVLTPSQRATVIRAMQILQEVFRDPGHEPEKAAAPRGRAQR